MKRLALAAATAFRKLAWEGERLRWRLFHPVTLGARVILIRENEVLLVRHTYRTGWFFPGGGVDKGETLEEAARREAEEEAGATVHEVNLLGLFSDFNEGKSDHVAVFYSRRFDVHPFTPGNEIAERAWFSLDNLPAGVSKAAKRRLDELAAGQAPRAGVW